MHSLANHAGKSYESGLCAIFKSLEMAKGGWYSSLYYDNKFDLNIYTISIEIFCLLCLRLSAVKVVEIPFLI